MYLINKKYYKYIHFLLSLPLLLSIFSINATDTTMEELIMAPKLLFFIRIIPIVIINQLILVLFWSKKLIFNKYDFFVTLFAFLTWYITYKNERISDYFLIRLIVFYCFYLCLRINISSSSLGKVYLIITLLLAGWIEAVRGILQFMGYFPSVHHLFRITGTFTNPGPYGGFLAVICILSFSIVLFYKSSIKNNGIPRILNIILYNLAYLTLFTTLFILPSTQSRTAWLAAITGCGVAFFIYLIRFKKDYFLKFSKNKYILCIIIGLGLTVSGIYYLYGYKKESADGRLFVWKVTLLEMKEIPIGTGWRSFPHFYSNAQEKYFKSADYTQEEVIRAGNPEYAFNEYLQILVERGIVTFIVFILLISLLIYKGLKEEHYDIVFAFIGLLVFAFFSYPFSQFPFIVIFLVFAAQLASEKKLNFSASKVKNKVSVLYYILFLVIGVYAISFHYQGLYKIEHYKKWKFASTLFYNYEYEESLKRFEALQPYLSHELIFLFEYGKLLNQEREYDKSNVILEKAQRISCDPMLYNIMGRNYQSLKEYDKAEKTFLKSSYLVPNRFYPHYLLAKLYFETKRFDECEEQIGILFNKSIKISSTAIKQMKEEMENLLEEIKEKFEDSK